MQLVITNILVTQLAIFSS